MGAQSSGLEDDGGTLYPTLMNDTNGNFDRADVPGGERGACRRIRARGCR